MPALLRPGSAMGEFRQGVGRKPWMFFIAQAQGGQVDNSQFVFVVVDSGYADEL